MSFPHYLGSEAGKHLVWGVRGSNQQTNSRRISLPFLNATLRSADAKFECRTGSVHRFARQKVRVIVHHRIPLIDAQRVERVDKLGRQFVHQGIGYLGSFECMLRSGGGC